ncbi:MAG TPA: tyrosine--tRNA ligase [Patescibacteria group bacterium]
MAIKTPGQQKLKELLTRGVEEIIAEEELEKKLRKGEQIRIYYGIDPTSVELHIGHAVILRKLKEFQALGHEVILLIGDFTAQIGDPSGRTIQRVPLTHKQVLDNAKTYQEQASKILDFESKSNPVKIKFNGHWLQKLTFKELIELSMLFTVQQFLERDMFQDRLQAGKPIGLHEFLYPLMQGYDSLAMDVDMEVAGSDQLFNMLIGRDLLGKLKNKSKIVMTFELLEGLDGRKMSKTFNNFVGLADEPSDMYGKIMSMKDELITRYFKLCTDVSLDEIKKMDRQIAAGGNPRDFKMKLAWELVKTYYSVPDANSAEKNFINVFQKKKKPEEMEEFKIQIGRHNIVDLLVNTELVSSKSEARRVIEQGGVKVDDKVIDDPTEDIEVGEKGVVMQKGKLGYVRVVGE